MTSEGGITYALDAATGKPRWQYAADSFLEGSPVVLDGAVCTVSSNATIYALRALDGSLAWSHAGTGADSAAPIIAL